MGDVITTSAEVRQHHTPSKLQYCEGPHIMEEKKPGDEIDKFWGTSVAYLGG